MLNLVVVADCEHKLLAIAEPSMNHYRHRQLGAIAKPNMNKIQVTGLTDSANKQKITDDQKHHKQELTITASEQGVNVEQCHTRPLIAQDIVV